MNATCLIFGILFFISGILFMCGKLHIHLTAWKQMSEEEKQKIDIIPLCRNIGGMIVFCSIIFLLAGIWPSFKEHIFVWAMIIWLIISGIDVYLIEKSKRYIR